LFALAIGVASPIAVVMLRSDDMLTKSPGCDPEVHICSSLNLQAQSVLAQPALDG